MKTFRINYRDLPKLNPSVSCVGFFDGVHKGHKALMAKAISAANEKSCKSAVLTFDPDPWVIFHPERKIEHITPMNEKIKIANSLGFDYFYILEFTKDFAALSIDEFHKLVSNMNISMIICGFDFQYGNKNAGNIATLKKQTLFDVVVVDSIDDKNGKISSTRIEQKIKDGFVLDANRMMGHCYTMEGQVEHGFGRGSKLLNIPTANLHLIREYVLPKVGVYSGMANINGILHPAMINIGMNPTFNNSNQTIEVHILDFDQDLYGKLLRIYFYDRIRSEMRFSGVDALKTQLQKDLIATKTSITTQGHLLLETAKLWNASLLYQ